MKKSILSFLAIALFSVQCDADLVDDIGSSDRKTRIAAAKELASAPIPIGAVPAIIDFAKSEIRLALKSPVKLPSSKPEKLPPRDGMVSLNKLKAKPADYASKTFAICGKLKIHDNWTGPYSRAEKTHYSLWLYEIGSDDEVVFENVYAYLSRDIGSAIIDAITSEKDPDGVPAIIHVAMPWYNDPEEWDCVEIRDVQFLGEDGKWQPPTFTGVSLCPALFRMMPAAAMPDLVDAVVADADSIGEHAVRAWSIARLRAMDTKDRRSASNRLQAAARKSDSKAMQANLKQLAAELEKVPPKKK